MNEEVKRSRAEIVSGIAHALAAIYFTEVVEPKEQTAEELLKTQARMKALHEAILTARDLLGIIDKATEIGSMDDGRETGVVILPEVSSDPE